MEGVGLEGNRLELLGGHANSFGILGGIEAAGDLEAALGCGGCDQFDNDFVTGEWLPSPVLGDEREQTVFDLVPLAGPGREVANRNIESCLIGQLLQLQLPQPDARPIAASAIGGNEQPRRFWITLDSHGEPPLADALDSEGRRVVVRSHVDPAGVFAQIVYPVGCVLAQSSNRQRK